VIEARCGAAEAGMEKETVVRAAMQRARRAEIWSGSLVGAALLLAVMGCGDDEDAGATTTSSSSSFSSGPGGTGGGGGAGGGGSACLDPSLYADLFTIEDPDLCAVALYDADLDLGFAIVPTWGRHGGPMTVDLGANGEVDVARWELPAGPTGALTMKTTAIPVGVPANAFVGAQAIDLPFFNWTAVSWAGQFPSIEGEVVLAEGAAIEQRYDVQSLFSGIGLAAASGQGRFVSTGLSPLEDPMVSKSALYAADSCGTEGMSPRLLPEGDGSCGPPIEVASWGDSSGPLAADRDGNVFVVLASFGSGDQEARGFAAAEVGRGTPPAAGAMLFKVPGYGASLSALAPANDAPGLLAFQPSDGMAGPLDVIVQRYSAGGGSIKTEGGTSTLLKLGKPGTPVVLMSDDQDRLWAACPAGAGGTRFVVLARM
jgi:hypothetical protein